MEKITNNQHIDLFANVNGLNLVQSTKQDTLPAEGARAINASDNKIQTVNSVVPQIDLSTRVARIAAATNCKTMAECEAYLKEWFLKQTRKELNLDNPQTYNEKIQWMKLYDSTPLKTRLTDKYLVREWVKEKIGEKYLVPLLGVWDKFDDINFDKLPEKFVLKCNHGSGWNIIVTDKSKLNLADAKQKIDQWMNTDFSVCAGLELHYRPIERKIIAEEYLENNNDDLYDYKVWCSNGKADYVMFLSERKKHLKMVFFNREWQKQNFVYSHPMNDQIIPKPENLNEMLDLAEKLAKDMSHVRVDFYRLNDGTLKFGEMTFTSASGNCGWNPPEQDKIMGDLITLPEKKPLFAI